MSTAWVFPGQDAFEPTTGLAWALASEAVRDNLRVASELTGLDLLDRRVRRRQSAFDTAVVQPLLTAVCLGIARELDGAPDVVAGASLGELSAWAIATDSDAVELAAVRGRAMRDVRASGGMVAVRGTPAAIEALCADGVSVGARNGESEWVLTGEVARVPGRAVPVTGPWHAPAMAPAASVFAEALPERPLRIPFALNDAGRLASDGADARAHLIRQLTHPADWYATVQGLVAMGVTDVVTVGPGRVLRTQLRRIAPQIRVRGTDRPQETR